MELTARRGLNSLWRSATMSKAGETIKQAVKERLDLVSERTRRGE